MSETIYLNKNSKTLLKDAVTKRIYEFTTVKESSDFVEEYADPQNLICIDELYFDGSGWNGETSAIAYSIGNRIHIAKLEHFLTNNEAEYYALYCLVRNAPKNAHVKGDSALVINQVKGDWKCNKERLNKFRIVIIEIIEKLNLTLEWIPRNNNVAGNGIDKEKGKIKANYLMELKK